MTYKTMNTQQVYSDTATNGQNKLHNVLNEALYICECIDCMCEWCDQNLSVVIDALRENDHEALAARLTAELEAAFGERQDRYDVVSFFRCFDEDGKEVYEREDVRQDMTWDEAQALMDNEGWKACDVDVYQFQSATLMCVYFHQF